MAKLRLSGGLGSRHGKGVKLTDEMSVFEHTVRTAVVGNGGSPPPRKGWRAERSHGAQRKISSGLAQDRI